MPPPVWRPLDLPKGYYTPARGQSRTTDVAVPSGAVPELARGRAPPGRRDATRPLRHSGRRWALKVEKYLRTVEK